MQIPNTPLPRKKEERVDEEDNSFVLGAAKNIGIT